MHGVLPPQPDARLPPQRTARLPVEKAEPRIGVSITGPNSQQAKDEKEMFFLLLNVKVFDVVFVTFTKRGWPIKSLAVH